MTAQTDPRQELARRRADLLSRSSVLRDELARQATVLDAPLGMADRTLAAARWLRDHPAVVAGAVAVTVVLRPRRAWRWSRRAWALVGLYRRIQPALAPFLRGLGATDQPRRAS